PIAPAVRARSLHDALPIYESIGWGGPWRSRRSISAVTRRPLAEGSDVMRTKMSVLVAGLGLLLGAVPVAAHHAFDSEFDAKKHRSEEHTSELQSRSDLVCR